MWGGALGRRGADAQKPGPWGGTRLWGTAKSGVDRLLPLYYSGFAGICQGSTTLRRAKVENFFVEPRNTGPGVLARSGIFVLGRVGRWQPLRPSML